MLQIKHKMINFVLRGKQQSSKVKSPEILKIMFPEWKLFWIFDRKCKKGFRTA